MVSRVAPFAFAVLFVSLACALIPHAGIEGDEAFFSWPIYGPFERSFGVTVFHRHITLMVFPYAGSLKTLLYWPILKIFGPNVWSVRLPVVLIGAVTIVVFFRLAERMAGLAAALLAGLLLATDPSFILTNTFDWGPVAIEHLLLISGCLLIVSRKPAWGFFCFGLALWNKAVFIWALAGLIAGVLAAYSPEVRKFCAGRRRLLRCAAAFAIGALPLIVYNLHSLNGTARANVHPSFEGTSLKLVSLRQTLEGSDLFGVIVSPESEGSPKPVRSIAGRVAAAIASIMGRHGKDLFLFGILAALLSAPVWWRTQARQPALFAAVFSIAFFLTMASVRYTGGAHHIVLMYPMPQLFVGAALSAWRVRWIAPASALVLVIANLLTANQYVYEIDKFGPYGLFSDANTRLSDSLSDSAGDAVYCLDYGIGDSLNLLHRDRLHLQREWVVLLMPDREVEAMIANPHGIFIDRVPAREYYKGAADRVDQVAKQAGYRHESVRIIQDSNGRDRFEIFRFEKIAH